MKKTTIYMIAAALALTGCRSDDEEIVRHSEEEVEEPTEGNTSGFYLLNEGNMGSNKCTLDFYDASRGVYKRNIYGETNPGVVQSLGDVGNDLQIYDGKLYAVVNGSNLIEVMDAATAKHITQISIPNCRYIVFNGGYAYVTSFAGPIQLDPNARIGYVAKIDTHTMTVVDTVHVGYQPEQMAVCNGKLYVANSGGYRVPNYDNRVSVIDLKLFRLERHIKAGINLYRVKADPYGYVWVSSRGDYYGVTSKTYVIDSRTQKVTDSLDIANTNMTLCGDTLLAYGSQWNYTSGKQEVCYCMISTKTRKVISNSIITDGTEKGIAIPYGLAVNRKTREIFITDARDYVSPGRVYCFSPEGKRKWDATTGDIPAHFAFLE